MGFAGNQCCSSVTDGGYVCENGRSKTVDSCMTESVEHCVSCNNGYFLDNNSCVKKQCVCENGFATHGNGCDEHGSLDCWRCNEGYTLDTSCQCKDTELLENGV